MPRRRVLALLTALVVLAGAGLVAFAAVDGDAFGDPPRDFPVFRTDSGELRHPPGWRSERTAPSGSGGRVATVLRPAGANPDRFGPVIEIRALGNAPGGAELAERRSASLVRGSVFETNTYDLDVPGAERTDVADRVFKAPDGRSWRVTSVRAFDAEGNLTALDVRGPVSDGDADPRVVAGSLRLR